MLTINHLCDNCGNDCDCMMEENQDCFFCSECQKENTLDELVKKHEDK